jgi:hypothetical protein
MLIEAQVMSLNFRSTSNGERIYAVFKTIDGNEVGIWAPADHAALQGLRSGDTVSLRRSHQGHLHLAPQPLTYLSQLGIFALLNRSWRLI